MLIEPTLTTRSCSCSCSCHVCYSLLADPHFGKLIVFCLQPFHVLHPYLALTALIALDLKKLFFYSANMFLEKYSAINENLSSYSDPSPSYPIRVLAEFNMLSSLESIQLPFGQNAHGVWNSTVVLELILEPSGVQVRILDTLDLHRLNIYQL